VVLAFENLALVDVGEPGWDKVFPLLAEIFSKSSLILYDDPTVKMSA